jgi:hypothetical protein
MMADMSIVLSFERDTWERLDLVPLGVRRKLDLAALKISLAAWQALTLDERRLLRDLPAGDEPEVARFAAALGAAAARAGVGLEALPDADGPAWRAADVPAALRVRAPELDVEAWRALDDEARYFLVKLAEKRREPERFAVALAELVGPRARG